MPGSLTLSLHNAYETLAISVPTVVDAARGRLTREACDERLRSWARKIVEHNGMRIEVHGRENVDPDTTYLVMSNHQSHYDVPVLFHVLGGTLRMVAKVELFRFPVFGRAMLEAGFIPIDRQSREKAMESLREAKEHMKAGVNVWIAPEGTRSPDGRLLPFKKGGFHLALDVGVPILPVTLQGTRRALPRGESRSRRGAQVRVTLHPPIALASYQTPAGVDALMTDVRARIESAL
ncbi:MAG TPA: lysophospholipid acyltransferase family protein [Polyangiaceae bacterium]|nr:lysophospholipid acyltransferase family protein [Polyangiaceae bacterium]